ncbi:MAG: beta-ketoacyl-[acyl-carrier-protein] synthase II, partial [Candidatus Eremiobacteraeota bacterium]|nr:beta-ketoacyl-[acyl-carrier-protein] synthase II [Candidatus Eremiobacteraeota bacterium]
MNRVVVTGLGPVSAVGCGKETFWQALTQGKAGFGPITLFDPVDSPSKVAAEVKDFALQDYLPRGKALARMHARPSQFALASAALALEDAGLSQFDHETAGLAVGTGLANIELVLKTWNLYQDSGFLSPIAAYQVFHHNIACAMTSIFDLRGSCHTLSSGCNSGLDALGFALRQI